MKKYGGVEVQILVFSTSALVGVVSFMPPRKEPPVSIG
jgi:hypothetical protein